MSQEIEMSQELIEPLIRSDPLNHSDESESEASSNHSDEFMSASSNHSDESESEATLNLMSQEIQSHPSSNHSEESEATSNPVPSPLQMIRYLIQSDTSEDSWDCLRQEREERKKYLETYLPLYEASIRCDWKAAAVILDKNQDMELVRCKITENGETALHIAASAKAPKEKVDEFVKNLVERMTPKDLELVNNNHSTALYLAAAAGNIESVKIMMEKNKTLHTIPGGGGDMMPLYAAVLFGHKDVAEYLYDSSTNLKRKDGWDYDNRELLLEKCVESDMFDIALKIVETHPFLRGGGNNLLGLLARKPEAFHENKSSYTESSIIKRTIKSAKKYPYLERSISLFRLLARKLEAFHEKKSSNTESNGASHGKKSSNTESNMIRRTVKSGVCEQSVEVCSSENEKAESVEESNTNHSLGSPEMLKKILMMVCFKLMKNPNMYASILGLSWALVS